MFLKLIKVGVLLLLFFSSCRKSTKKAVDMTSNSLDCKDVFIVFADTQKRTISLRKQQRNKDPVVLDKNLKLNPEGKPFSLIDPVNQSTTKK